jgi:hypothetical protein
MTVMMASGFRPSSIECARMNQAPHQMTTSRPARLSQWRAGSSTGFPLILAESLPKAMSEPEKVTAPMSTPM